MFFEAPSPAAYMPNPRPRTQHVVTFFRFFAIQYRPFIAVAVAVAC